MRMYLHRRGAMNAGGRSNQFPPEALVVWVVVALALAVRTWISPDAHTAFPVFAGSSQRYWNDEPLYGNNQPLDYFRYPPVFAVVITPFAALGHRFGGILWSWLSLAVYGAGAWSLRCEVLPASGACGLPWSRWRNTAFLLLVLLGALRGLWNAQSNAPAVALLLLGAAAVIRQSWWRAALFLAGSVSVKLTPLAPVLLLCALEPRRLFGRFLAALALINLIPFLTGSPFWVIRHYEEWWQYLCASSSERWVGYRDAWTLWLVTRQMQGFVNGPVDEPLSNPIYRGIQILTGGLVLLWCLARQRHGAPRRRLLTEILTLGTAWLMLFGPSVEHSTYAFLAPMLAWALLAEEVPLAYRWLSGVSGVLILVFGWGAISSPLVSFAPWLFAALPLGSICLVLWVMICSGMESGRLSSTDVALQKRQRAVLPKPLSALAHAR